MVRQTAAVITLELIGGILLLAVAGVVILAFLLASGPVELNIFKQDVERALEEARDGRDVEIERLTLQWSPSDRRMIVAADNLRLANAEGKIAAQAEEALITLDAGSLIFGRTVVLQTELRNGWVDVQAISPTQWTFAGEPLPQLEIRAFPTNPAEVVDRANGYLSDILAGLDLSRQSGDLETASFKGMDLKFRGAEGELIGEMTDASGSLTRSQAWGMSVELAGGGEGLGLPGDLDASLEVPIEYDQLSIALNITNWSLGDLASRLGAPEGHVSGFPADIGFGAVYEAGAGLTRISLSADAKAGQFEVAGNPIMLNRLKFDTVYEPLDQRLAITELDLESDKVSGVFSGALEQADRETQLIGFDLTSEQIDVDITPYFPAPWRLKDTTLQGTADFATLGLSLEAFAFTIANARIAGEAAITAAPDANQDEFPAFVEASAEMEGTLEKKDILPFWPETLGTGARDFAILQIESGTATAANVRLSLKPDSFEEGFLRDDDLDVRFFVEGARVKFLEDLPPVTNGVGSGRLSGNGFSAQLTSGEYGGWQVSEGSIQFPKFNPKGELFRVFARGTGPAVDVMRNVSNSRLQLQANTGFDPERVSGDAELTFEMYRPALSEVPIEELDIKVTGTITNAGLKNALPGLDLVNGEVDVDLTQARLVLTGFGDIGPAPVQFTWRDEFDEEETPANLSASAFVSPDFLNRFGFVGRAYLSGEIPVELQALVSAAGAEQLEIGFDLQQSRIDVAELGWIKPAGQTARATLSYDKKTSSSASTFRLVSDEAKFDGDIELSPEGRLQSLTVRQAFLEDFLDVRGRIDRSGDQSFESNLEGAFLNASPFFGDFGTVGNGAGGLGVEMTLSADIDTLRLRDGLDLHDAKLDFQSTKTGVREVRASGQIGDGQGGLSAVYTGPTVNEAATISLESDDAGFFMRGLLGQDFLSGGTLSLNGSLSRGSDPARLRLQLQDVRMKDAPFMTQVLSLASLRGLADTLGGEGVLFTTIEVPITIAGERYIVEGARANGPALGLTLNGWIGRTSDDIRLSGVLVPSFGMNSMLGGVPIIGDLFVGREGEGIFSLTYSVRGTLDKAQVSINPLSAVTPGILRRIFENPADTTIPDSLPVDPNLTPPAPPMPDAEFIPSAPGSN